MSKQKAIENLEGSNALVSIHTSTTVCGRSARLDASISAKDKARAEKLLADFEKARIAFGKAYIRTIKVEWQLKKSKLYTKFQKPESTATYSEKEWALFASDVLGLQSSQANDDVKINERFFRIVDENGEEVDGMKYIGNVQACDYSKTALIALSTLTDEQLEEAVNEGLKPDMKVSEVKEICNKVKPKKEGKKKESAHPCSRMDFESFPAYIKECFMGFSKSEAWKAYACSYTANHMQYILNIIDNLGDDVLKAYDEYEQDKAEEEAEAEAEKRAEIESADFGENGAHKH